MKWSFKSPVVIAYEVLLNANVHDLCSCCRAAPFGSHAYLGIARSLDVDREAVYPASVQWEAPVASVADA